MNGSLLKNYTSFMWVRNLLRLEVFVTQGIHNKCRRSRGAKRSLRNDGIASEEILRCLTIRRRSAPKR
jgi:hypothetical protein